MAKAPLTKGYCDKCGPYIGFHDCPYAANNTETAANRVPETPKPAANKLRAKKENTAPMLDAANTECQTPTGEIPAYMASGRYKDADKRRAYMREYQRRKRAEAKANGRSDHAKP